MSELRDQELSKLRDEVAALRDVVGTLISWLAQSAGSPLSHAATKALLERLVVR
jgi:hypothetical protein